MVRVGPGFGGVKPGPAGLGLKTKRDNPDLKSIRVAKYAKYAKYAKTYIG
jgi:hypothetical protein